jgi:hypothetical protein
MRARLYPAAFALLSCIAANAQSPDWVWANTSSGGAGESASATATDANGDVFVTGAFDGTSITFGSTTLNNEGYTDIFLVKYNSAGQVLWARSGNGLSGEFGSDVAVDAEGNVIIVGYFGSSVLTFGGINVTRTGISGNGFIAKYDPDGNVLWARNVGDDCSLIAVDADPQGSLYATGTFSNEPFTFGSSTLTPMAGLDAMLVKYDAAGDEQWAAGITGDQGDYPECVTVDPWGDVIVGGFFTSSTLHVGNITLSNVSLGGNADGFIAKYNGNGVPQWANGVSGQGIESVHGVATDGAGNVAITGIFDGESLTLGSTTLTNTDPHMITLIAKYTPEGAALWATAAVGGDNQGNGIAVDPDGALLVTGYFAGDALSFGAIDLSPGSVQFDIYVVKCDGAGNFQWGTTAGSDGVDHAWGISTDEAGSAYITGEFGGTDITFGGTTLVGDSAYYDYFVAKLNGSVGIVENTTSAQVLLVPNPASDRCTLRLPQGTKTATVTINDPQGRRMSTSVLGVGEDPMLDVSDLLPGAYEVVVAAAGATRTGRLIIAR